MNKPDISVIISVFNASKTLVECIQSLLQQTIPFELIIVDDGSTDNTITLVKSFPECTVIHTRHGGPAHARNQGVKIASGNILVFVDADMTFEPSFLEFLVKPIQMGTTVGTWTKEEHVMNWDKSLARAWNAEYTKGNQRSRIPHGASDKGPVFRAIKKAEFDRVNGFSSGGYTDDWSLAKKLGIQADHAPGAIMYHRNPDTWSGVFRQAAWTAKREYKLGEIGRLIALLRATLPISIIVGCIGVIRYKLPVYLPFKIVFDAAIVFGILSYWCTGKTAK